MGYRVEWSTKAVGDLGECVSFQIRISKDAALKISAAILAMGNSLAQFPMRFPVFPMVKNFPISIRKCVVDGRYIILYGVQGATVMIYRVLDSRRKFGGLL